MAQLLVFGVDSPQTAEKILDLTGDRNRQQLLQLADAAWVERRPDGKVKLHQSINLAATGAARRSSRTTRPSSRQTSAASPSAS